MKPIAFDFEKLRSVEFGVCLDTDGGETYRLVPADGTVQSALREMLASTIGSLTTAGKRVIEFSPAEKYATTERLWLSTESDLAHKHATVFASENLVTDTHGLDEPGEVISYFAIFRDSKRNKLMAFRKAAQFKGVVKKKNRMVALYDDTLKIVPDQIFKLDDDFDFLILADQILIWRPNGFIFTADMDSQIAACAAANVDRIATEVTCVDFTGLRAFVANHKLAMRLVAAIKSRGDLALISPLCLASECTDAGVEYAMNDGKLVPTDGSEMGFLMLLDRRRYTVTLIEEQPETYEASSRHLATE